MTDRPIFLYTGIKTGTIFTRTLLETHPGVGWCLMENLRLDRALQPGFCLPGGTFLRKTPDLQETETVLAEFVQNWICGDLATQELLRVFYHWERELQLAEPAGKHQTPAELVAATSKRRCRDVFGWKAAPKDPGARRFFHEHVRGGNHRDRWRNLQAVDVVFTARHPLATVASILQRVGPSAVWDFWGQLDLLYDLPGLIWFPVDLPGGHGRLIQRLGLPPHQAFERAALANPAVNATTLSPKPGRYESPAVDRNQALVQAKQLLAAGRLHPILAPWWRSLRQYRFLRAYEALGYDFDFRA